MSLNKHYESIRVGDLEVDGDMNTSKLFVQREAVDGWAETMVANWDEEMLLPAIISRRKLPNDSTVNIILDGQNSNKAAIKAEGEGYMRDCLVYENLTPQQEAKLFLAANKHRKAVRPFDNFRVSLTAGDATAIQVQAEVRSIQGLDIAGSPSTNRVGAIQALFALSKKPGMITRVLTVASKAWGFDQSTWDNLILRAVGMVLTGDNWDLVDDARLIKVLKAGGTPALWKTNSVQQTPSGGGSSSRSYPMAQKIVSDYNGKVSRTADLDRDKWLAQPNTRTSKVAVAA